jgi:hypothetical protein
MLWPSVENLGDDVIDRVTHRNAIDHFRYDPFAERPREECTVGALRASAADVDVTPKSVGRRLEKKTGSADLLSIPNKGLT